VRRPHTLSDDHQIRHVGWGRYRNQLCQVTCKSIHRFWLPEGSKFAVFLHLALNTNIGEQPLVVVVFVVFVVVFSVFALVFFGVVVSDVVVSGVVVVAAVVVISGVSADSSPQQTQSYFSVGSIRTIFL